MFRRSRIAIAAALVAVACGGDAIDRTDTAADSVSAPPAATRIVSLSPSLTELLFALGAGDRMVGRTRWCTEPAEAAAVPSIGDGLEPNLETIVGRDPDLVVFYASPSNAAAVARLHDMGIRTVSIPLDRLEDVASAARTLGRVVGGLPTADTLAGEYLAALTATSVGVGAGGPSVLMLAWDAPPIVIGAGSYLSEMVELAGGRNIFADLPGPSATVSIEAIAARDPDVVLFVGEAEPTIIERPEWRAVPAIRNRRFAHVRGTQFSWPSLRSPAGVSEIAEALARVAP